MTIAASFIFGTIIGSFLNVCIYRIPRGISLVHPARSFCPNCKHLIPWHRNFPILSWLLLRGRCGHCHAPISRLYLIVETLTALLFAAAAVLVPLPTLLSVWVILSILVVTTFVDLEFFIIPDALSKSGIAAGLLLSLITPQLHKTSSPLVAVVLSLSGAFSGAIILFLISEFGKLAFGRYKVRSERPTEFSFHVLLPDERQILIDREPFLWSEHFFRKSDRIIIHADEVNINGAQYENIDLTFFHDRLVTSRETILLDQITHLSGHTAFAQFPREAMGLGDVKLIAAIGTFVGWKGILFTIAAASFLGAAFGIMAIALGKRERSAKIPFGPYLAIATVIWLFWGETLVSFYQESLLRL
ncbi:MAG: prepilin peptidase [Verrucomicrobia bacterium]|nr:prepilin peptidase [Verrucomicrobiota bacterium]